MSLARLLVFGTLLTAALLGQGERATVTGTVTDPTGAIVVGADVAIRNVATNVIIRTKTNNAGIYYLPALPPARYELRVESGGFRPAVVADIPLGAGLTANFNLTLEVGTVTEAVEVQATAVQLESQTSGLGKILATRSIAELPALGRNPLTLLATIPGVQPVGGATSLANSQYKMSGGTATQNGLLTDGGENRAFRTSTNSVVSLESVAEMRVDTATYAAEFGRSGGGVINLVTKSGTNQLHGVGYEFIRNDHLNANSWQNNRSAVRKGLYQQNQFGAAVGGPIVHDRTFFFFNYEGVRQGTPIQNLNTAPTEAQRRGDFTGTLDAGSRQVIVYDPTTTRADPSQSGRFIRDPFSGNSIPQSRINPVSLNVLKYWPAANRVGEGPTLFNNYFKDAKSITPSDFYLARIDHVISDRHRLFGRFNARQAQTLTSGLGPEDVAFTSRSVSSSPVRNALVSLTSTFTPSLLGELRFSFIRLQSNSTWDGKGFDIASLGFPSSLLREIEYNTFPNISVAQYTVGTGLSVTSGSSAEVGSLAGGNKTVTPTDVWQFQYHVTWLRNRHKIKLGADLQLLRLHSFATNSPAGAYFFDRVYTQGPDPLVRSSFAGNGFASMLLGIPVSDRISFDPSLKVWGRYYGLYFQDDVQLTRKLTANLGLRYEYATPFADKFGQVGYFDFQGTEPITGSKGTFKIAEPGQYQTNPNKKNFGPRVGLAYSLTSKTVIRAAGAVFFAPTDTLNPGTSDWGNGLFILEEGTLGAPSPFPNTPPPGGSWSNPFASGLLKPTRTETFPGQNLRTFNREHALPYVSDWNLNIQHMVTPTLMVQAGYVGSKVTHLAQNRFYNQNDPLLLPLGSALLQQVPNPFLGKIKSGSLSFPTVERRQLLRPYPQYLQFLIVRDGYGDQHYEGFQLRVDKQLQHGLNFTAGYTLSKTITNNFESATGETGPQNALYNPNYSRAIDTNDVPQRLVLSYMWELPFGSRKAYLSSGLLSHIVGNWQVGGITVLQSGIPLRIAAADATGLLDFGLNVGRGNRLKDPVLPKDQRTMDRYFDTTAFALAPPFTMPNDSITQPRLRDFGRRNFDMSMIRNQPFKERYNVQFRAEFFNVFNTPALALGSGSSVTVNTPQFGKVLAGASPREIQLGLRLVF